MTQKINSEVVLLLGWGRAILLQLAHPLVASGVADHSSSNAAPGAPLRRLRQTLEAMLLLTFGTPEDVARAAGAINAIHDRVHGKLCETAGNIPAGTRYSAHDREWQRCWGDSVGPGAWLPVQNEPAAAGLW